MRRLALLAIVLGAILALSASSALADDRAGEFERMYPELRDTNHNKVFDMGDTVATVWEMVVIDPNGAFTKVWQTIEERPVTPEDLPSQPGKSAVFFPPAQVPSYSAPSQSFAPMAGVVESCPVHRVNSDIGQNMVREGTEACAFEWRPFPHSGVVRIPHGWIATLHLAHDDKIVVWIGDGSTFTVKALTVRWRNSYPPGDPARDNACGLVRKEQEHAFRSPNFFVVHPGNFSCPSHSSISTPMFAAPAAPSQGTITGCPVDNVQAASLLGGNPAFWREHEGSNRTGWEYGHGGVDAPSVTLTAPSFGRLDVDNQQLRNGQSVTTDEATFWCQG